LRRVGEKQDNQRAKVDSAVDYLRMQQEVSEYRLTKQTQRLTSKVTMGEDRAPLVEADTDEAIARRNNLMAMLSAAVSSQSQGNKEEARANAPTIPDALALAMEEAARVRSPNP